MTQKTKQPHDITHPVESDPSRTRPKWSFNRWDGDDEGCSSAEYCDSDCDSAGSSEFESGEEDDEKWEVTTTTCTDCDSVTFAYKKDGKQGQTGRHQVAQSGRSSLVDSHGDASQAVRSTHR